MKKSLIDKAVSNKLQNLQDKCVYTHSIYDSLVFNKTRDIFGGRVRFMTTASAPIGAQTLNFMKIISCCPVLEGKDKIFNLKVMDKLKTPDWPSCRIRTIRIAATLAALAPTKSSSSLTCRK
jgi:hypothetical protein